MSAQFEFTIKVFWKLQSTFDSLLNHRDTHVISLFLFSEFVYHSLHATSPSSQLKPGVHSLGGLNLQFCPSSKITFIAIIRWCYITLLELFQLHFFQIWPKSHIFIVENYVDIYSNLHSLNAQLGILTSYMFVFIQTQNSQLHLLVCASFILCSLSR